ncbi:Antibiotic biosynthesis monooxygenase [compost metagenome]
MVLEIAQFEVSAGNETAFEAGVAKALPLFERAKGCGGAELRRIVERPGQYVLLVRWQTVEDHTIHFRESQDFQEWRRLVGSYFASPPAVFHAESLS